MLEKIVRNISNLPGWRTNRKIIVVESDDWGSIRMSSMNSFEKLQQLGLNITGGDSKRYNSFDTLESAEDLQMLFETLSSLKNHHGLSPVITALCLSANPDFDQIKASGFQKYYREPFTDTLDKYKRVGAFEMYKEGIKSKLFEPQFHGREHLNVAVWMRSLQRNDHQAIAAFNEGVWGYKAKNSHNINFQAAFDLEFPEDIAEQKLILEDGLKLFSKLHGYPAKFFVPPNGPINNQLEETAASNGIRYISAQKIQMEVLGDGKHRRVFHYLGQRNKWKQTYITRNCFFEPSVTSKDWVASCMDDIGTAFRWKKPAVISTHRVNYVGSLDKENRKRGLSELQKLFASILRKWPEAEFLTSAQLAESIVEAKR